MCSDFAKNTQTDEVISAESEISEEIGASDVNFRLGVEVEADEADLGFRVVPTAERRSESPERLAENDQSDSPDPTEVAAGSSFPEKKTAHVFRACSSCGKHRGFPGLSAVVDRTDAEGRQFSSGKRQRFSEEEKGKQINDGDNLDDDHSDEIPDGDANDDDDHSLDETFDREFDRLSVLAETCGLLLDVEKEKEQKQLEHIIREVSQSRQFAREIATRYGRELHEELLEEDEDSNYYSNFSFEKPKKKPKKETTALLATEGAFHDAMEVVKKRQRSAQEFSFPDPSNTGCHLLRRSAPSLLDLSTKTLGRHSEVLVSLADIPEDITNKIADAASDLSKVDVQFVNLLTREHPTNLRLKNCSQLTEEDMTQILCACTNMELTELQLGLCGQCVTEYMFRDTFWRIPHGFPALITISLRGAFCLTDAGLALLSSSAPALQSIDLSQCSLLTSKAMSILSTKYAKTLKELYIEDCKEMLSSSASALITKFKQLEVLSVGGIEHVNDHLVAEFVKARGADLKDLFLANCSELTTRSIKFIGNYCPHIRTLDLSHLTNLTDEALQYLANGCQSIHTLKFCRNDFSDVAVAAFLEVSGESLYELSLNNIRMVERMTVTSLAKRCSKHLHSLDLSWCRKLSDSDLSFLLQSCPRITRLKLFGLTQIPEQFIRELSKSHVQIIGPISTPTLNHLGDP